ncbi:MAG: pantoate--beta-alanine ligase [Leptolyngbyaceae cyanobacterium CAN_BIN12]|nr:pantoate--beta-alanine ligase [Leptolyngbyaceae cyanobacterium CAN_BIN12]
MRLFTTILGLRCYLESCRLKQHDLERSGSYLDGIIIPLEIGFVPTMGALHAGHLSLIQRARRENKIVVVSIFVNPLQFAPTEDFQRYPRSIEQDQALCEQAHVDALFMPNADEMGTADRIANGEWQIVNAELKTQNSKLKTPSSSLTQVIPPLTLTSELCGRFREGHFQGVATIVTKLLTIVQPTRAYFGQKDAQQLAVIHQLVKDLNLPVEILECAIAREASGLALSSRNQYLTDTERQQASTIYQALQHASHAFQAGERLGSTLIGAVKAVLTTAPDLISEYVELVHPMTMTPLTQIEDTGLLAVAARIGSTRLIDNVLLSDRKPIVAIDGPAGAGKSTVARLVAQTLGLFHLDTGAMYRALTWLVMQSGIAIDDEPAIAELVSQCQIEFREQGAGGREQEGENPIPKLKTPTQNSKAQSAADANKTQNSKLKTQNSLLASPTIFVNGQDVTQAIRSLEVTSQVSAIAAQPAVRWALVRQQQLYGKQGGIVVEGRDIGTNVFPDAELKIFLTASVQERARRRQRDLQNQGIGDVNLDELEQAICDRDRKDSTRSLAPLRKADDAIELITDGLTIQAVIDQIVEQYNAAINF